MKKFKTIHVSKEELYVIERDADIKSGITSKNIFQSCESLLHSNMIHHANKKNKTKFGKIIMNQIQEQHRSYEVYKSIRDKCEMERLK